MASREQVIELLHELPEESLGQVEALVGQLLAPVIRARMDAAPFDDEPLSEADLAAIARADEDMRRGRRVVSMAEAEAVLDRFFQEQLARAEG